MHCIILEKVRTNYSFKQQNIHSHIDIPISNINMHSKSSFISLYVIREELTITKSLTKFTLLGFGKSARTILNNPES